MLATFTRLIKDDEGATAIEYGLIAGLVSVAAITALTAMGGSLDNMFSFVSEQLDNAVENSGAGGGDGGGDAGTTE